MSYPVRIPGTGPPCPRTCRDYDVRLNNGVEGLRIAYSPTLGYADVDPEIAALVETAKDVLAGQGAVVEQIDPGFADPAETFRRHWFSAAAYMINSLPDDQKALVDPGLQEIAAQGADITMTQYMEAVSARNDLGETMSRFLDRYDLLLTPTLPLPAFKAGEEVPDRQAYPRWTNWTPFTFPFNLTQNPAATVPCGFTSEGLPAGMQIIGAKDADALVLRAARAYETSCPFRMPDNPNIQH